MAVQPGNRGKKGRQLNLANLLRRFLVLEKLLLLLRGAEYDHFVNQVKPELQTIKRVSYGKQVGALEKLVYSAPNNSSSTPVPVPEHASPPTPFDASAVPTPPLLTEDTQSPQSSSLPSTNTSTVDGPIGDTKTAAMPAPVVVASAV